MPTLATLRRQAAKQGYGIRKVREDSRSFWEYGPFYLVDAKQNTVVRSRLTVDEVAAWVAKGSGRSTA